MSPFFCACFVNAAASAGSLNILSKMQTKEQSYKMNKNGPECFYLTAMKVISSSQPPIPHAKGIKNSITE